MLRHFRADAARRLTSEIPLGDTFLSAARPRAALAALLLATGCTARLYPGPTLPLDRVAVIHAGSTVVREIDGQRRRGGAFDAGHFEVAAGPHRLALVFELPARTVGLKSFPAQAGTGMCVLEFTAGGGKRYYLGSRPLGEWHAGRWDGSWEGWVRDPTVSSEDDVIARCTARAVAPPTDQPVTAPASAPLAASAAQPTKSAPASEPPHAAMVVATPAPTATTVPGVPAAPTASAPVRLGAWNLGKIAPDAVVDYAGIAAAIDASFDLVALSETTHGEQPGYHALLHALAPAWAGMITHTPAPGTRAERTEFHAFLYRRARLRPCADSSTPAGGCFEAFDVPAHGGAAPIVIHLRPPHGAAP